MLDKNSQISTNHPIRVLYGYVWIPILPFTLGALIAGLVYTKYQHDIVSLQQNHKDQFNQEVIQVGKNIETQLNQLYRGLRTIARLPAVRQIISQELFTENFPRTIQELYNNMASDLDLSEVYITLKAFSAGQINPTTGKEWEPLLMFDEFIVGRTLRNKQGKPVKESERVEEVEIYEYRLIERQIKWFQSKWPSEDRFIGLDYPAISGEEVITCDNTQFDPHHPNDMDRSGLVYSVPFYNEQGDFNGVVSGILLSHILRSWLPDHRYVLYNSQYQFAVSNDSSHSSELLTRINQAGFELTQLEQMTLNINDGDSIWKLAAKQPDTAFWDLPAVQYEREILYIILIADTLFTVLLMWYFFISVRHREELKATNATLEKRIQKRTLELEVSRDTSESANRAKTYFLSSMSHELRTPLNAILGFSQLLQMDNLNEEQLSHVDEIINAGNHLTKLISEMLDLARIEAGHIDLSIETIDIEEVIADSLHLIAPLAETRGIEISLTQDGADISSEQLLQQHTAVRADPTRLKQALLNLLSNAIKYNRENGKITIAYHHPNNSQIRISVTDTGTGLTQEQQSQLFTLFDRLGNESSNIEGTGIGMVITKNIIELMGGNIGVESQPGEGTTFWIELSSDSLHPAQKNEDNEKGITQPQTNISTDLEYSVLYIEDNAANLRLVARLLGRRPNIKIWSAYEPLVGLKMAEMHKLDLILLDINLPGMDGYEVLKQLRQRRTTRDIPVIAISANAMPKDIERGLEAGFDDYIIKPIDVFTLLQAVDKWLSKDIKTGFEQ